MREKRVQWQPISALPLIGSMIDDFLDKVEKQQANLHARRSKPHVLDDHTVGRVIKVYSAQAEDLWLYEEQLSRRKSLNHHAATAPGSGSVGGADPNDQRADRSYSGFG